MAAAGALEVAARTPPAVVRDAGRTDLSWLNAKLVIGGGTLLLVILFGLVGPLFWDTGLAYVGSSPRNLTPTWTVAGGHAHPLGTENMGRDMLAQLIVGTPASLKVGFIASAIGLGVGLVLGSLAGYLGGKVDNVIRTVSDSVITIPSLAVLVVIAAYVKMTDTTPMALILALFAWPGPTRVIRSQVLTLRERGYVRMATLSGASAIEIMFGEMVPNMLPWLAASFTGGVSGAILGATGLEVLGLGPTRVPSLGMIINHATTASALLRGMVWWWLPPILMLAVIFTSLFLITIGLDEIANPRLRGETSGSFERGHQHGRRSGPARRIGRTDERDGVRSSSPEAGEAPKVLEVDNLSVHYLTPRGAVIAANEVSFFIRKGEIVGLVGESGCGKTTVAMAILQLVQPPGKIVGGEVRINGRNILGLSEAHLRAIRWRELALVPQGAMNSLNPVLRIREQLGDAIVAHERLSRAQLRDRILQSLDDVGLPARVYSMYPHELSGGMKQRVCIAMAVALNPPMIIADEPTSALDVVVQRVVAQTLLDVKARLGVSMLMIGHDMGLQAQMVDRVAVMYGGHLVEIAPVDDIFSRPRHPYTQLLIESIPSIEERKPLKVTEGLTHDLRNPPPGCIFQYRCPLADDRCRIVKPPLERVDRDHFVACLKSNGRNAG